MTRKNIKIVILSDNALTQRALNEFALDELASTFDVEYWNCNAIAYPKTPIVQKIIERPYVRTISSEKELEKQVANLPYNTIGVRNMFMGAKNYTLHKIVSSKITALMWYVINYDFYKQEESDTPQVIPIEPTNNNKRSVINKVKQFLYKNETLHILIKYLRYRGDERYQHFIDYHYSRKAESLFKYYLTLGVEKSCDYQTCHPDYDKVLEIGPARKDVQPYIVFIDAYYPMHPDWHFRMPWVDWNALRKPYYESMNKFFDEVEKIYQCKVIIAAHPSADYTDKPFGDRECIQFKSVELVRDSKAVILHSSSSINFIAYYDKPICFVDEKTLHAGDPNMCFYSLVVKQSVIFNKKIVDVNNFDVNEELFSKIDPEIRKKYIDRYFGDISRGIPNSEILKEHFESIHKRITQQ